VPNTSFDLTGSDGSTVAMPGNTGFWTALGFQTPISYGVGAKSQGLGLFDTNGDGRPDLIVTADSGGSDVSLLTSTESTRTFKTRTITGASNLSPIVITSNNTLAAGDLVTVRGVGGNTAANGVWQLAGGANAPTSTTFTLSGSTGNGVYKVKTGTWISAG